MELRRVLGCRPAHGQCVVTVALIQGVLPELRPVVDLDGSRTFWDIMSQVNRTLKRAGMGGPAEEFRKLAEECENEVGLLIMAALYFVQIPEDPIG